MRDALALLKPPQRMSVVESASKYLYIGGAGGYDGLWDPKQTPYLKGPMNRMTDRKVQAVVCMAPAQSGKTNGLIGGALAHSVITAPADMMIIQSSQAQAQDFSKRVMSRYISKSPQLRQLMGTGHNDNVFNKKFKNGVYVNIGWPTLTQLSGKSVPWMVSTDYDAVTSNVDNAGDLYGLMSNRIKALGSRGRVLVESSPTFPVLEPDHVPKGHAAPVADGIAGIYNQGDRNRWYWTCLDCGDEFRADWEYLSWDKEIEDPVVASATAVMVCPHCGSMIAPKLKGLLNERGNWRSEADKFEGSFQSKIASYWFQGPAVAFQTWEQLVYKYLFALKDFETNGNQEKLRTTINTDQGRPYAEMTGKGDGLDYVTLRQRAGDYAQQRQVPAEARFVTTAVDVQKHRFVVQVMAWGVDGQRWIVDRYNLSQSTRVNDANELLKVDPFTYPEDWNVLDKLLDDEYVIAGTEAKINSRMIVCDSGGRDQATNNAYTYALRLKRLNRCDRFALLKGASSAKAPRIARGKAGDDKIKVPLWIINTTILKDETAASLARAEVGPNYTHLPDWVGEWFFKELTAETRTPKGWFKKRKGDNNEAFDLCGYNSVAYSLCGGDKIDWKRPPEWAAKPLGDRMAEVDTVQASGNEKYLKYIRERAARMNGE
jgi:phage terminase large subunit GpA-like protein